VTVLTFVLYMPEVRGDQFVPPSIEAKTPLFDVPTPRTTR
jgi:hypothetical protein